MNVENEITVTADAPTLAQPTNDASPFVVDEESGQVGRMVGEKFVPVESIDEIGENTSRLEYRKWVLKTFAYDPAMTLMFLVPLLGAGLVMSYFIYASTGQLFSLLLTATVPFIITYNILIRMITDRVIIIHKDENSGDYYGTEDEFWLSDVRNFPAESFHLNQESKKWIAWFDTRDGVKIVNPWLSKQSFDTDDINASDVMGTESYLRTTFNIGNMRPKKSLFQETAPNLLLIGIGCIATFLAADRIAEMLNL